MGMFVALEIGGEDESTSLHACHETGSENSNMFLNTGQKSDVVESLTGKMKFPLIPGLSIYGMTLVEKNLMPSI